MRLQRWQRPPNYAGESWPEWYVFLGQHRDSDCLTQSNFAQGLKELGGESETVRVVHEGHWAVGWVEWIGIHESDTTALAVAECLMAKLADYPILDEEDFGQREQADADVVWRDCYTPRERVAYVRQHRSQFDFADWSDLRHCLRGEYFAGYAGELIN